MEVKYRGINGYIGLWAIILTLFFMNSNPTFLTCQPHYCPSNRCFQSCEPSCSHIPSQEAPTKHPIQEQGKKVSPWQDTQTNKPQKVSSPARYKPSQHGKMLDTAPINPLAVLRIQCWMMQEFTKRQATRETTTTSMYLLRAMVEEKGDVKLGQLQELGIACMMISSKVEGVGRKVEVCERTFSKERIAAYEMDILRVLGFRIRPPTHVTSLQAILHLWRCCLCPSEEAERVMLVILEDDGLLWRLYQLLDIAFIVLLKLGPINDCVINALILLQEHELAAQKQHHLLPKIRSLTQCFCKENNLRVNKQTKKQLQAIFQILEPELGQIALPSKLDAHMQMYHDYTLKVAKQAYHIIHYPS